MVKALVTVELKVVVEARDLEACKAVAPFIAEDIFKDGDHIEFGKWRVSKNNEPGRVVCVEPMEENDGK